MAKIKLLIDTDIFIDALKEVKSARELFRSKDILLYCSILTRKELLSKRGLKDSERRKIMDLFLKIRVLRIDDHISRKYFELINRKHFEHIKEIKLIPAYNAE